MTDCFVLDIELAMTIMKDCFVTTFLAMTGGGKCTQML